VIESYVQRTAAGLVGAAEGALLWDAALGPLRAALERGLEGLPSAEAMLAVKEAVVLMGGAMAQAGYEVSRTMSTRTRARRWSRRVRIV